MSSECAEELAHVMSGSGTNNVEPGPESYGALIRSTTRRRGRVQIMAYRLSCSTVATLWSKRVYCTIQGSSLRRPKNVKLWRAAAFTVLVSDSSARTAHCNRSYVAVVSSDLPLVVHTRMYMLAL